MTVYALTLFDVIATPPVGLPFGQTFTDESLARRYAAALRAIGYTVETTPAYCPVSSIGEALHHARAMFSDERIADVPEARQ